MFNGLKPGSGLTEADIEEFRKLAVEHRETIINQNKQIKDSIIKSIQDIHNTKNNYCFVTINYKFFFTPFFLVFKWYKKY